MLNRTLNQTGLAEAAGLLAPVLHGIYNKLARYYFCDARDVVTYWACMSSFKQGKLTTCSGQSLNITRLCELLLAHTPLRGIAIAQRLAASANGGIFSQAGSFARLKCVFRLATTDCHRRQPARSAQ